MDRPPLKLTGKTAMEGLRIGFNDPVSLYKYMRKGLREAVMSQSFRVCKELGWDVWGLSVYWDNVLSSMLYNHIVEKLGRVNYGQMAAPEMLYVLVRKLCPTIVVETGVSAGVSSAFILQALEDNEHGYLYSIDYPHSAMSEAQNVPITGLAVPANLKHRWTLVEGKSEKELPPLLNRLGVVDMFLHDSEHSYENMLREYQAVWYNLKFEGLLLSHDINDNKAFKTFAKNVLRQTSEVYFTNLGIIKK